MDNETLQLVAEKSKFLVQTQVDTYKSNQSNAGIIVGAIAVFIPFFLGGLQDSNVMIRVLAIMPLACLVVALTLLLQSVLFNKKFGRGFKHEKFDELSKMKFTEALLQEIGANRAAYTFNERIIAEVRNSYNIAVVLTIAAIIFATGLLFIDRFTEHTSNIQKIEIIKR